MPLTVRCYYLLMEQAIKRDAKWIGTHSFHNFQATRGDWHPAGLWPTAADAARELAKRPGLDAAEFLAGWNRASDMERAERQANRAGREVFVPLTLLAVA